MFIIPLIIFRNKYKHPLVIPISTCEDYSDREFNPSTLAINASEQTKKQVELKEIENSAKVDNCLIKEK